MVWSLIPVDPLADEDKYYIFSKGTYKVGRKGCDVIITKDKGVSRIHAEILIDEMISIDPLRGESELPSRVRIRDCSKYGTYVNKDSRSKAKVHDFPNKETSLKDGDVVSFGSGNATYRFCFVPLVFFVYCFESFQVDHLLEEKVSSIGARITNHLSDECTHVLADELMPVKEDLVDAIVTKKPIISISWVELVAGKRIGLEIPSWSSYTPTLSVEGVSVKVTASETRSKCLEGYTCVLESINMYKFKDRLQSLLEVGGAKTVSIEEFCSNSERLNYGQSSRVVCVIPRGSQDKFNSFNNIGSLSRVDELDLLCAVLSGHLDSSVLISPSVLVSTSCSTEETIVADSDAEVEIVTSNNFTTNISNEEAQKCANTLEKSSIHLHARSVDSQVVSSTYTSIAVTAKGEVINELKSGNSDIVYSQDLIIRDLNLPATISSTTNNGVVNFKRFRKGNIQSGNSFNNLIPFSKYPYKESEYGNQEMLESVKEEKRRKQMEAIAEDLFNSEKGRRRGAAGSIHELLSRG